MTSDDTALLLRRLSSVLGATAVGAGAFGAHALKETLSKKPAGIENWRTAVTYQMFHAVTLLALSALSTSSSSGNTLKDKSVGGGGDYGTAGKMMAAGTVLFSGSIYCLCLDVGPKKLLGPTTPLGGLLMVGGWAVLGLAGR